MDKAELIERLKGYEWNDIEFKEARVKVPKSAYETVSAFANTEGGWLVFGVRDGAGGFEIVGVLNVDKVQNDFLSALRSNQKLNRVIAVDERLIEDDGKVLLIFHIPEARRQDKPICLRGDIGESYIRRGAGDERCTGVEIERLLRDAAYERHDGGTVDLDAERCFDDGSLHWYRKLFYDENPGHDETLSHVEFLHYWGLVVEAGGRLSPTRAAILLFGAPPALHQVLPRPVVDWQWNRGNWSEELADERWADRLVIETNLVEAWKTLRDCYFRHADRPFSVNAETLQREDRPPGYIAFREAAINLLIHQDYADHTRKAVIRYFGDRALLQNPGDAYASADDFLEPGDKELRNPKIVAAFRRIGLSEQAGTGIRAIFGNWRQLGHVPPIIDNDRTRKAFQLTLLKEELLSRKQVLFQASLGLHLSEAEARAFAFVCREGRLRPRDVRAVSGLSGADVQAVLDRLANQALISPSEGAETPIFVLAEHLRERLGRTDQVDDLAGTGIPGLVTDQVGPESGSLVTDQAGPESGSLDTDQARSVQENLSTAQAEPLTKLTSNQRKIIEICDIPRSLLAIMAALGVSGRWYFRKRHLDPLLRGGVLRMTHPDQPSHPDQAYVLTEAGLALKAHRVKGDAGTGNRDRSNGA